MEGRGAAPSGEATLGGVRTSEGEAGEVVKVMRGAEGVVERVVGLGWVEGASLGVYLGGEVE